MEKYEEHIYKTINQINKFIENKKWIGQSRKYQVRGYNAYKYIAKYCKLNNISHELIVSDTITTNLLNQLIVHQCMDEQCSCANVISAKSDKVPVIYIKITNCRTNLFEIDI
jgi:hypothetical protein